jgi:hypothetical protein
VVQGETETEDDAADLNDPELAATDGADFLDAPDADWDTVSPHSFNSCFVDALPS